MKSRYPHHPGTIVPIITDPDSLNPGWTDSAPGNDPGIKGRYTHAGDTVRAYCRDSSLNLVAVVCASRGSGRTIPAIPIPIVSVQPSSPPKQKSRVKFSSDGESDTVRDLKAPRSSQAKPAQTSSTYGYPDISTLIAFPRPMSAPRLAMADETTLLSLYRANVVEPLAVIKELGDLLATAALSGRGRGRIIFVNGSEGLSPSSSEGGAGDISFSTTAQGERMEGALRVISAARAEATRLLRAELTAVGIDVCEVVAGE